MVVRKLIAISLVAAASVGLSIAFMAMLGEAEANEIERACNALRSAPKSKTIQTIPTQAPDFTVVNHKGEPVKLSDYRGKVVLVNFWASWCETCEAEKPTLERLQRSMDSDDLVVLALASDQEWGPIVEKLPDGSPLSIVLDKPEEEGGYGPVAQAYGIRAVPESFVVDRSGTLRHYFINKRDWDSSIAQTCLQAIADE